MHCPHRALFIALCRAIHSAQCDRTQNPLHDSVTSLALHFDKSACWCVTVQRALAPI